MRRFLIGLSAGMVLGYVAVRTREAIAETRAHAPALQPNPQEYGRLRRALMLAGMARSFAALAAGAYALGPLIEPRDGIEPRPRRIALVGAGLATTMLLDLPVDYVEGLTFERRYGLTKQSDGAWLADRAKSTALTLAIAVPLIELLASAIERAPRRWPALATAASFPLLILANVIVPTFIAPMFNTFEPVEGELASAIRTLASRYGAGDATILRVDMSRQTEKANAYVTGLFGTKRIVIGDTLLDRFEPAETLFVVAHELGHYVHRDVWRGVALGTLAAALVFYGARRVAERGGGSLASAAGLARLFFGLSAVSTLAGPPLAAFSRERERAADTFALVATGDGAAGASAFERLRERNLAEDEQPKWMETLFASHPSLRSRIDRLRAASAG
jgi:STE24 endopeptidase